RETRSRQKVKSSFAGHSLSNRIPFASNGPQTCTRLLASRENLGDLRQKRPMSVFSGTGSSLDSARNAAKCDISGPVTSYFSDNKDLLAEGSGFEPRYGFSYNSLQECGSGSVCQTDPLPKMYVSRAAAEASSVPLVQWRIDFEPVISQSRGDFL